MDLLGIHFYKGTYADCLAMLKQKRDGVTLVVTPNPEMLYDALRDNELLDVLRNAQFALPDGAGIFVAYQIMESTVPSLFKWFALPLWCFRAIIHSPPFSEKYGERITGARLTRDLIDHATREKIPVTIIDPLVSGNSAWDRAKKVSQETMKRTLEEKFPWIILQVIISNSVAELNHLWTESPMNWITFATHGNGKQEKLLNEVVQKYPQCGLAIGVWGSIDLITGFRTPAPRFFQRFGGEWLYRLIKNPKRHSTRMRKVMRFLLSCFKK